MNTLRVIIAVFVLVAVFGSGADAAVWKLVTRDGAYRLTKTNARGTHARLRLRDWREVAVCRA